jgi:hypothetical protein
VSFTDAVTDEQDIQDQKILHSLGFEKIGWVCRGCRLFFISPNSEMGWHVREHTVSAVWARKRSSAP